MKATPLERRDWFVSMQARKAMSLGVPVNTEALQRQSAEDLRLVDVARSNGALRTATAAKPKPKAPRSAENPAARMAGEIGGKFYARPAPATERKARGMVVDADKLAAMVARIRLITQRTSTIKTGQDLESAYEYKALARAIAEEAFNHGMHTGRYFGLGAADRDRVYWRAMEDICDRSNAVIRPGWWIR